MSKKLMVGVAGLLVAGGLGAVFAINVSATYGAGATGASADGPCTSTYDESKNSINCCLMGSRCPHWIDTDANGFKTAVDNGRALGNVGAEVSSGNINYDVCSNLDNETELVKIFKQNASIWGLKEDQIIGAYTTETAYIYGRDNLENSIGLVVDNGSGFLPFGRMDSYASAFSATGHKHLEPDMSNLLTFIAIGSGDGKEFGKIEWDEFRKALKNGDLDKSEFKEYKQKIKPIVDDVLTREGGQVTVAAIRQAAQNLTNINAGSISAFCGAIPMVDLGTGSSGNIISKSVATGSGGESEAKANTGFAYAKSAEDTVEVSTEGESVSVEISFKHFLKINKGSPTMVTKYHSNVTVQQGKASVKDRPGGTSDKTLQLTSKDSYTAFGGDYTVTVKVPKNSTGTYAKVCERITYTTKSKNGKVDGSETSYTEACISIEASKAPEVTCKQYASQSDRYFDEKHDEDPESRDHLNNYREAQNGALSFVVNETKGTGLVSSTFARPGDNVRFIHCYYAKAYKVKDIKTKEIIVKAKDNYCEVTAEDWAGGDYLLGNNKGLLESTSEKGDSSACAPSSGNKKGKLNVQEDAIVATLAPPSNSNGYKCLKGKTGFYEVVGSEDRDCSGSLTDGVLDTFDLGNMFKQTTIFNRDHVKHMWDDISHEIPCDDDEEEESDDECPEYYLTHENPRTTIYEVDPQDKSDNGWAKVYVPFNFDTEIEVSSYGNANVVYPGGTFTTEVSGTITSAKNSNRGGKAYTTATPENSKVYVTQFLLSDDVSEGEANSGILDGSDNFSGGPEAYAGSIGGYGMVTKALIDNEVINPDGEDEYEFDEMLEDGGEVMSVVPDVPTGTKICSVAGIYPTDSHDNPDSSKNSGDSPGRGDPGMLNFFNGDGGTGWRISAVSCRTIVKKPNFQAWNGGVYSGYGIETSITQKCVGLSEIVYAEDYDCYDTDFGSWSEYEAIAGRGAIRGFASAAGLGYDSNPLWDGSGGRIGGVPYDWYDSSFYNVSHLSVANTGASARSGSAGYSNITIGGEMLARLLARYTASTDGGDVCSIGEVGEDTVWNKPNHTLVYRCHGTATIRGDIITGDDRYSYIDDLPQVLVIADNINISSNVTEVDAWLVATNNSNAANGTINTCVEFSSGSTPSDGECSEQLTVNGPTIAGQLILNRSYGAEPAEDSIEPAERFILRPDAFMWAYAQAEDYHQAFTTYTRELAPRY